MMPKVEPKEKTEDGEEKVKTMEKMESRHQPSETEAGLKDELLWEDISTGISKELLKGVFEENTFKAVGVEKVFEEEIKHGRFKCNECDTNFTEEIDLKSHMAIHTGAKDFICNMCGKLFKTNTSLLRHQGTHEIIKPHQCKFCETTFTQSSSIKRHIDRSHTEHSCIICSEKFQNGPALIRHSIGQHEGEKPHRCEECGKGLLTKRELTDHMRRHTGEKPFDCGKCGKLFMNTSGLRNHKKKHGIEEGTLSVEKLRRHEAKRICCEHCGKHFFQPSHYARHVKGHKGIKEFQCDQCDKAYTSGTSLSQHVNVVHEGKKSFVCNECGHHFGRRGSLKVHILIHSEELPFRCDHCFEGFKEKVKLKSHMSKIHLEKRTTSRNTLATGRPPMMPAYKEGEELDKC